MTIRSTMTRTLTAAGLLALVACGDARLGKLAVNMTTDSLAVIMKGPPHRTQNFILNGKVWDLSVYDYGSKPLPAVVVKTSMGGDSTVTDSIPWRKMSPVIIIDSKVVGWGWGWWDKESAKLGIPLVPPAK